MLFLRRRHHSLSFHFPPRHFVSLPLLFCSLSSVVSSSFFRRFVFLLSLAFVGFEVQNLEYLASVWVCDKLHKTDTIINITLNSQTDGVVSYGPRPSTFPTICNKLVSRMNDFHCSSVSVNIIPRSKKLPESIFD